MASRIWRAHVEVKEVGWLKPHAQVGDVDITLILAHAIKTMTEILDTSNARVVAVTGDQFLAAIVLGPAYSRFVIHQ